MGRPPIAQGFPDNMFDVGQRDIVDQLRCAVCLGVGRDIVSTPCGHVFCQECLGRWFVHQVEHNILAMSCPMCRGHIAGSAASLENNILRNTITQLRTMCATCDWVGSMIEHRLHNCPSSCMDTSYITVLGQRASDLARVYRLNRAVRTQQRKHTSSILDKCSICQNSLDEQCVMCAGYSPFCQHPPGFGVSSNCR